MLLSHFLNKKRRPNLDTKEIFLFFFISDLQDMMHSDLAPVQPKNTFVHFLYLGTSSGAAQK